MIASGGRCRGSVLVELIAYSAGLALLSAGVFGVLLRTADGARAAARQIDAIERAERVLDRLRAELARADGSAAAAGPTLTWTRDGAAHSLALVKDRLGVTDVAASRLDVLASGVTAFSARVCDDGLAYVHVACASANGLPDAHLDTLIRVGPPWRSP